MNKLDKRKEELNKYIEDKYLKCRKENDLKNAISYYNSLFRNP